MLHQNYTIPFNPMTIIKYKLPHSGHFRLDVYDILGQYIRTLVDAQQSGGHYRTIWDGTDEHNRKMAAWGYFFRLKAGDFMQVIKLALVK